MSLAHQTTTPQALRHMPRIEVQAASPSAGGHLLLLLVSASHRRPHPGREVLLESNQPGQLQLL